MKNLGSNLKLYWRNFNRVANGDWTLSFGIAIIFGVIGACVIGMIALLGLVAFTISFPWLVIPAFIIFVAYRLGYAAVKGK